MFSSSDVSVSTGNDGLVMITAGGLLDLTNTDRLHDELRTAAIGAEDVTLDLQTAKFIDTAVVQYIANAAITLIDRGKRLRVLVCENSHPQKVLKVVGFEAIMNIAAGGCGDS